MKWALHLKTINHHKKLVLRYCFKVGLYRQGLLHDLSKYTPVEFSAGARFFQGFQSPNNVERKVRGFSAAWLHHKGRNKHHLEYWIDYAMGEPSGLTGMEMPVNYVVEMFCDRIAASRTYLRDTYTDEAPLQYYLRSRDAYMMHENTRALLEQMLTMLRDRGEAETFAFVRHKVLKCRKK